MFSNRLPMVVTAVALAALSVALLAAPAASAAAAPRTSVKATGGTAIANPAVNAKPSPNYNTPCWAGGAKGAADTTTCHTQELAAINHQHDVEGVARITLPSNFWTLTPMYQTFVVTNLERTSRGLKPFLGLNTQLNAWAAAGALGNTDPAVGAWNLTNGTRLQTFASIWASDLSPLDADFVWMYSDGWTAGGTANSDCTSAKSTGCWSHRQVILYSFNNLATLVAGVASISGHVANGALNSDAESLASYTGSIAPTMMYTWAQAVALGAH